MAAKISVRCIIDAPPPESVELADGCIDIPVHQVHEVEGFGMVKEGLVTFDPGHGILRFCG